MMQVITTGETRWVVLVGEYALKVPRLDNGGRQFLLGCLANMNERWFSRAAENEGDRRLARTFICAPIGLLAVAERVRGPVLRRRMTHEEAFSLPLQEFCGECGVDDNGHNVARREDGSLVVLDYGNPGLMYVPEGPRTHFGRPRGAAD